MTIPQTTVNPDEIINVNDSLKVVADTILEQVKNDPNAFLQDLMQKGIDFGMKLLAALAIYFIGAWIIRRIKKVLGRMFLKHGTEGTLSSFVTSLVTITLTVILIIITIGTLGINTTSIAALLAAGGMAIGMALSGTVSNFAGGLMLLIFKPFKAGDFICAQGYSGTVKEVTIVNTKIVTLDNRVIVIPNGALSNGNIDNYSSLPLRRVDFELNVAYGTDSEKCMKAILEIAGKDKRILTAKKEKGAADPFVALSAMNDSTITFTVRLWVKSTDYWPVKFDMNNAFYSQLPESGIQFAYPHMNVTIEQ